MLSVAIFLSIAALVGIYEIVSTILDFQFTATIAHYLDGDAIGQQLTGLKSGIEALKRDHAGAAAPAPSVPLFSGRAWPRCPGGSRRSRRDRSNAWPTE